MEISKNKKINQRFHEGLKEEENRIKTVKLTLFLKKVFPNMTKEEGRLIWDALDNRNLIVDGEDISGTFRYNAACIASIVGKGTDYLTFYCSWLHSPREKEIIEKIEKAGGKVI